MVQLEGKIPEELDGSSEKAEHHYAKHYLFLRW